MPITDYVQVRKYKLIHPMGLVSGAAVGPWAQVLVGTGTISRTIFIIAVNTGTTASSSALLYSYADGLNSGNMLSYYIDWSKRLEWHFGIIRFRSDAQAVAHFQLKPVATQGDLANQGLGIRIDNYTVVGEAYGTARQTVALGTLTDSRLMRFKIVLIPGVRVEFWVNDVLTGTLTGTALPTGNTTDAYLLASIINGVTGGVNATLDIWDIKFLQEW